MDYGVPNKSFKFKEKFAQGQDKGMALLLKP